MKKILILEDNIEDFETIKLALMMEGMSTNDLIFPSLEDKTFLNNKYQNDFYYLKNKFRELFAIENSVDRNKEITKIINEYNDIDLFIIDRELVSRKDDTLGIEFYNYLINTGYLSNKIYLISTYPANSLGIEVDIEYFVRKQSDYEDILINRIKNNGK
jgi:hypothetical protein